jgi:hypothetical protein
MKPIAVLAMMVATYAVAQIPGQNNPALAAQQQAQLTIVQSQAIMIQSQAIANGQYSVAAQAAALHGSITSMTNPLAASAMAGSLQAQLRSPSLNSAGMFNQQAMLRTNNQAAMVAAIYANRQNQLLHAAMLKQASLMRAAMSSGKPAMAQASGPMVMRPTFGNPLTVSKPEFSTPSGKVPAGTKITLKCDTHYSTLYYTTDGWTPTTLSQRYVGPIKIDKTTHLRVIAMGPNFLRSPVGEADYTVTDAKATPETTVAVPADGTLKQGTQIRLTTSGKVSSDTAKVGDSMPMVLAEDIKFGDTVIAAKGAKVDAILTIADANGSGAGPGDLVFEVQSLDLGGKKLPLFATETMEGKAGLMSAKDAVIEAGMPVTAYVLTDTSVKPDSDEKK